VTARIFPFLFEIRGTTAQGVTCAAVVRQIAGSGILEAAEASAACPLSAMVRGALSRVVAEQ